jgi:hypothetical protein
VGGYNSGMKMMCVVWSLTLVPYVLAVQTPSKAAAVGDKQDRLRASGGAALQRVKATIKTDPCGHYSGQGAAQCMAIELKSLEQDERIYTRAISGMLRIVSLDDLARGPFRLMYYKENLRAGPEFDAGEVAWRSYKKKTCTALSDSEAGGSIQNPAYFNCLVRLTQNHMLEMDEQYGDLWH